MAFLFDNKTDNLISIKVIGVGGGGCNAVNRMVDCGVRGVEFIALNTDKQALGYSRAGQRIALGSRVTHGLGAGSDPEKGRLSAEGSREEIAAALRGAQMVFVAAGMGGGTGTGAAPVVAQIARSLGVLTIGVVTKPFAFEGPTRMRRAEMGIAALRREVDALLIVSNERLKQIAPQITLHNAFQEADDILRHSVQSIADIINVPSFVNLDYADVVAAMSGAGDAHMGIGRGSGRNKVEQAAENAVRSPLLESSIAGARSVILSIAVPVDVELADVERVSGLVTAAAHPDVNVFWGVAFDRELHDELVVTVIATNFEGGVRAGEADAQRAEDKPAFPDFGSPDDDPFDFGALQRMLSGK